jgi:F0F1-type ATP synthase assembly protein I
MVAGSEMVSFTLLGLLLDYALDTMPWLTIGLTLLGLVAAFFQLTKLAKALAARKKPPDPPVGEGGS